MLVVYVSGDDSYGGGSGNGDSGVNGCGSGGKWWL